MNAINNEYRSELICDYVCANHDDAKHNHAIASEAFRKDNEMKRKRMRTLATFYLLLTLSFGSPVRKYEKNVNNKQHKHQTKSALLSGTEMFTSTAVASHERALRNWITEGRECQDVTAYRPPYMRSHRGTVCIVNF